MSLINLYIGTYTESIKFGTGKYLHGKGEGIYRCSIDTESGKFERPVLVAKTVNPSFVAFSPDKKNLYAVNELKQFEGNPTGALSSFSVDTSSGGLRFLNTLPTGGTDPCHVAVDDTGGLVFVANFMSGSVALYKTTAEGSIEGPKDFVQHHGSSLDPQRQGGPHAHAVIYDAATKLLYVPDLGKDSVVVYRVDSATGRLEAQAGLDIAVPPGAGPRHIEIHPDRRYAYLVNELDSTVSVLAFDPHDGSMHIVQTSNLLPAGFSGQSTSADLHIAPAGDFLYCSNRGHDTITGFRIDRESGFLSLIGHTSTGGKTPRNFLIDPSGTMLIAANQDSDTLVSFRIDQNTGRLDSTGYSVEVPTPVCVKVPC